MTIYMYILVYIILASNAKVKSRKYRGILEEHSPLK